MARAAAQVNAAGETSVPEYSQEQAEALDGLATVLNDFGAALGKCIATGLRPSEALVAIGIDVPPMFRGTVDNLLTRQVPPQGESS